MVSSSVDGDGVGQETRTHVKGGGMEGNDSELCVMWDVGVGASRSIVCNCVAPLMHAQSERTSLPPSLCCNFL